MDLNPFDRKIVYIADAQPLIALNCDFLGTVEELGLSVWSDNKAGDRVAGMIDGGDPWWPNDGTLVEYVVVPAYIVLRL